MDPIPVAEWRIRRAEFRAPARLLAAALVLSFGLSPAAAEEPVDTSPVMILGARVFDGETVLSDARVLFQDGVITAVGPDVEPPLGTEVIDGKGRTLLPGLIDCHTHSFGDALERALVFGVTTELDMFTAQAAAAARRREQAEGKASGRADLFSAGTLITVAGGHGTQFGLPIPTLDIEAGEEAVDAFVAARIKEGSDWIKIVYEDGSVAGRELPTLSPGTLRLAIAAAQRRGKLAVVHVSTQTGGRLAVEAGADGLVHIFTDREADDAWVQATAKAGVFVIPTLTVMESFTGGDGGAALARDERLKPYLEERETQGLSRSIPAREGGSKIRTPKASVERLRAAGVTLLAGTDALNPGTTHGASLHRELELLVETGLTPSAALAAATSVPARVFGLEDRGRIAPGLKADLLLVEGDPTQNILDSRAIVAIWKDGHRLPRSQVEPSEPAGAADAQPGRELPWVLGAFEGSLDSPGGRPWIASTDQLRGGQSSAELEVVDEGAAVGSGALRIHGEIVPGQIYPWAGAMVFPGAVPMAPVDVSAAKELRFRTRGDGASYRVMIFAESLGAFPAFTAFEATEEWQEHSIPWKSFPGADAVGLRGILFSAAEEGPFKLWIDEVTLH